MFVGELSNVQCPLSKLVMTFGNQKFGIPRKYRYQIGIWYLCPKFLGIFLVFCPYLECGLYKIWLNIGIFRQNKNRLGIWFLLLPFHCYRFGLVCHFPESGISSPNAPSRSHSSFAGMPSSVYHGLHRIVCYIAVGICGAVRLVWCKRVELCAVRY